MAGETRAARRMSFDQRRESIVAAACAVVAKRGVEGMRVADVAAEAGISQPLVSKHFSSREEMLAEALTYADRVAEEALAARDEAGHASGAERVLSWLESVVSDSDPRVARSHGVWQQLWCSRTLSPALTRQIRRSQAAWLAQIQDLIRMAQEDGSASPKIDPEAAALLLVALADGLPDAVFHGTMSLEQARAVLRRAIERELGTTL